MLHVPGCVPQKVQTVDDPTQMWRAGRERRKTMKPEPPTTNNMKSSQNQDKVKRLARKDSKSATPLTKTTIFKQLVSYLHKKMDLTEIQTKKTECLQFLDDVLRPELQRALSKETETTNEIDEYSDLREKLVNMVSSDNKLETNVDLGHGKVSTRASVDDSSFVFIHVGMGFHVELSLPEAIKFADKRVDFLRKEVLRRRSIETEQVRQHIQASEMILDGFSAELSMIET